MGTQSERAIERMDDALAVEEAPKTKREAFEVFRGKVEAILPAVAMAMPRHVQPDRILRTIMTAVRTNPGLLDCSMDSLLAGTLLSAQLGLEIGPLGHAYLVPYNRKTGSGWMKEATFIIGYRGMLDLARRSGNIQSIYAYPVYKDDEFVYELGMTPTLRHIPKLGVEPADEDIKFFYAVAHLVGGGEQVEVMTKEQVDGIRARSKAKDSGPWQTDYTEMGRKTVTRRLFKWLPVSVEVQRAVSADETVRHGAAADMLELPDISESDDIFEGVADGQLTIEAEVVQAEDAEPAPVAVQEDKPKKRTSKKDAEAALEKAKSAQADVEAVQTSIVEEGVADILEEGKDE